MTKSKHTPTPWTAEKENSLVSNVFAGNRPIARLYKITDGSGRKKEFPDGVIVSAEEAHANAAFIVRACRRQESRRGLRPDFKTYPRH